MRLLAATSRGGRSRIGRRAAALRALSVPDFLVVDDAGSANLSRWLCVQLRKPVGEVPTSQLHGLTDPASRAS
jgi:hypothetical protein